MTWIVACTKARQEYLAKHHLEKQNYDVYLPLIVTADSEQPAPMFSGYLFVDVEPNFGIWRPITNTIGISGLGVLKTGESPSIVPDSVIETLQRREEAGVIRLRRREAAQAFEPGQPVRIHEGSFSGFDAVFERQSAHGCVRVLLACFGAIRGVDIPSDAVA
jgi:transcriptional antiterminator RfaH